MISILTSTYNNGNYLGEFIESVINQTYTDWELILIDDGSTDSTKEIVDGFNYFLKIIKKLMIILLWLTELLNIKMYNYL